MVTLARVSLCLLTFAAWSLSLPPVGGLCRSDLCQNISKATDRNPDSMVITEVEFTILEIGD